MKYLFYLGITQPTHKRPPQIESHRPDLTPDELDWVSKQLHITGFSKRNTIRQRQGKAKELIPHRYEGRRIFYKVEDVNKFLWDAWERKDAEQRKFNYKFHILDEN